MAHHGTGGGVEDHQRDQSPDVAARFWCFEKPRMPSCYCCPLRSIYGRATSMMRHLTIAIDCPSQPK